MFNIDAVAECGFERAVGKILKHFRDHAIDHLHVSLDCDAFDPSWMPGVSAPVPGGIERGHADLLMGMLRKSGMVGSLDVAELNPLQDSKNECGRRMADVLQLLFKAPLRFRGGLSMARLERLIEPLTVPLQLGARRWRCVRGSGAGDDRGGVRTQGNSG